MSDGRGTQVPEWSGKFVTMGEDDEVGQMAVHVADERRHEHPKGWSLMDIEQVADSEVYVYARTY